MAAVLDALAPYVKQMVKDMIEEEMHMLLGVPGEIEKLEKNVGMVEGYVANAERRRIDDPRVQGWVNKLKGAMYNATDILELCQLDAEKRRRSRRWTSMEEKASGCLRPLLFCLRNPASTHSLGRRIKALNSTLNEIRKEMVDFRFAKLDPYQPRTAPSDATPSSRMTTSLINESTIVGEQIERDTKALVEELLTDEPAMKIVSIVGAGGMGKTTLAKKIFNDNATQVEFKIKIWLSITQSYNEEKLLSSAITQAGGEKDPRGDKQVLTENFAHILSAGKFLIVMDDVWSNSPWTDILQEPVLHATRNQPGSRVIITTRNEDLVKQMGADYYHHHVKPMLDEDAWSLLKQQWPVQDVGSQSALDQLKYIGMEIIRKCDGLPLAIKAVGGLLRTKGLNVREWNNVLDDDMWLNEKTHRVLNSALRLSYEDLSPPVKQCFLYCSLIPKGEFISSNIIIGMWMSEEFLQAPGVEGQSKELEDVGINYYRDLITRNLIEPALDLFADGSASRMHDVIRSFAQHMAKEEALVVQPGEIIKQLGSSTKFRRLSIVPTEQESDSMVSTEWNAIFGKQELLRSLIINCRTNFDPSTDYSCSRFPSLRTLYVAHANSDRLVGSLCKLKHLRFLYLEDTDICRLPDNIDEIKFLQHIWLSNCANFAGQLPRSILKLEHLRTLCFAETKFTVPKGLGALTELRLLGPFPVQVEGEWCSLQELGPLSQLRELAISGLSAVPSSSMAAEARIRDKVQLRYLQLACGNHETIAEVAEEDCQRVEEVFDQLCPPPLLERLDLFGYTGRRAPGWMCTTAGASSMDFNSLIGLQMTGLPFCTQLPDGLCTLPSLEVLYIDYALAIKCVGKEFQRTGNSSARPPFPRLQELRFKGLPEWEEWEWDEEEAQAKDIAMPALHTLLIRECKLDRLPAGLASSRRLALRNLGLRDVTRITAVENFPSVVELDVRNCPSLKTIRGFPKVQIVTIVSCPALEEMEAGSALDTVKLADPAMETLPEYLGGLKPRILQVVYCDQKLRDLLLSGPNNSSADYQAEMDKVKGAGKLVVL
ncbi:hypothetical protein ACP70R_008804 [Stipagrostis hirtigluma subsp. patula]